ncbi:MAG: cysteine--tRNA ligase [Acidobacteria bacterium]|nr:MAG: cysteine--tRNA ligase [Acidobacteriota bacterium]
MIAFHNSLSGRLEAFEPLDPPRVGLYTCGPTVHDFAHIGNFRAYVWEDLLRRHLEYRGFEVRHVMNITDVEDKIIRKAAEAGVPIGEWTARFTQAFFEDVRTLRLKPAHHYPRATEHIPEMIELLRRLEERGHTYVADGSLYFRIASFPGYGRLSGLDRERLIAGARVDADEYGKDDPADFVLWKAAKPGEPTWDSPWGPGRPGWHIECSAMSMKYLGETFDIHTGGIDNKFPHHENEIAQSEGATGRPFVRYWLHCAHLVVGGEKMSKSLGNFYTLRELLDRGHPPRLIRHVLISTHYRKPLNFTFEALDQAGAELARIDDLRRRLADEAAGRRGPATMAERVEAAERAFGERLDDDLNVSGALGEVFRLVREANTALDRGELTAADAETIEGFFERADAVIGTLLPWDAQEEIDPEVTRLAQEREAARRRRDWATADRLRDEIAARGYQVEDTPRGPRLKRRR